MTLTEIAQELYGLNPADVIKPRDPKARELPASDRALSDDVKELRTPAVEPKSGGGGVILDPSA